MKILSRTRSCHSGQFLTTSIANFFSLLTGIFGRPDSLKVSAFLLSILSPVWKVILCSDLQTETKRHLNLESRDYLAFCNVLALGCGQSVTVRGFGTLLEIGRLADCYCIQEVARVVEWEATKLLSVPRAVEVLARGEAVNIASIYEASREMALGHFGTFMASPGFEHLDAQTLENLLSDERLCIDCEERVLEGVARWITSGARSERQMEGGRLLRRVRFSAMPVEYLNTTARKLLPAGFELDALILLSRSREVRARGPQRIRWEEGTAQRITIHTQPIVPESDLKPSDFVSMAVVRGLLCFGANGRIVVFDEADGALKARLVLEHAKGGVGRAGGLVAWKGLLVSWFLGDWRLLVWDPSSGNCLCKAVQACSVTSLAVSGDGERLLCGARNGDLKTWRAGDRPWSLACERERRFEHDVDHVVACGAGLRVVACCVQKAVYVVDLDRCDGRQQGLWHEDAVLAVAAVGEHQLVSASHDQTLRLWLLETGACTHRVQVYPLRDVSAAQCVVSLAVRAGKLLTRSCGPGRRREYSPDIRVSIDATKQIISWKC